MRWELAATLYHDFCPLCGSTFEGDDLEEVGRQILEHIDSGYCEAHPLPMDVALEIDSYEKAKGLDKE